MNRTVIGWAIFLLVFAVALMVSPIPLDGAEQLTPLAEIGVFMIPLAVVVAFAGGLAPDPERLTIPGALGSAEETELRQHERRPRPRTPARALGSPKEPVNCRKCYTLVGWEEIDCPRCRTPRVCRNCGGELERAGEVIECVRCRHWEVYCRCPELTRASIPSEHTRRRAVR